MLERTCRPQPSQVYNVMYIGFRNQLTINANNIKVITNFK